MNISVQLSDISSRKFRFWSFISMVLLVFVHGYNLNIRFLQPWTIPGEPLSVTTFTEYFLANGIFRFRIPMLFIISGFLYALQDEKPYKQRIHKRLRTLLLPYLLWSAIAILFTVLMETIPFGKNIIASTRMMQIDPQRLYLHDYYWYELFVQWIFFPVPYQLWFIRVLFIYNLAYPVLRWCVTNTTAKKIFFPFAALLWLASMGFVFFEGEGLLFFSLGVWIQKNNFDIDNAKSFFHPLLWGIAFVLISTIKTWLALKGLVFLGEAVYPVITILHKMVVISGLIATWYGSTGLVQWCMDKKWFVWLSSFSFIIYAAHAPLIAFAIEGVFQFVQYVPFYRMLTYILLPSVIIILSITAGAILRKFTPRIYGTLTGGRGL